jgi:ABC-type nitrate/sulfonate/bicarbonate transport system substrate-binding protein
MIRFLVIAFATFVTFDACRESRAASAATKVVVTNSAVNARVAPLWIARDQGFFKKYGTDTDLVLIRSGPLQVASLASGDSDVGYTGASTVLGAAGSGADLKILSSFTNKITYDLVARPGIKSPGDLREKRVGVQAIGGTVWMGAILGLEHLGLEPSRDRINVLVVGDQAVLAQGLLAGTIDATVLDGVYSRRLHERGFPILAEFSKNNIPFSSGGVVVRQTYLEKQSSTLENILKALLEANVFIHAPDKKAAVLNTLRRYLRVSEREAEEGYKDNLTGLDLKPYPSAAGIRNIQRLMKLQNPKIEKVKVEELIDDRILRKLDESGFVEELYVKYGLK